MEVLYLVRNPVTKTVHLEKEASTKRNLKKGVQ